MGNKVELTPLQRQIIEHDGGDILVSASAGSGKTFVMIERIIRLITDGKAEVGEILAVTYTNLAAKEMKQKLVKALVSLIGEGKQVEIAKKALKDAPYANFSTFHSFCSDLLRKYFYACGIDPLYTIADETEATELKKRAIDQLFMQKYSDQDADFLYLARIYRKNRSDETLKQYVLKISEFASSEARPKDYLENLSRSVNGQNFKKATSSLLSLFKDDCQKLLGGLEKVKEDCETYRSDHLKFVNGLIARLSSAFSCESIETFLSVAKEPADRMPSVKEEKTTPEIKQAVAYFNDNAKKVFSSFAEIFGDFGEKGESKYFATERTVRSLCSLAIDFGEIYSELKKEDNKLDFSDLEHFTYDLLSSHAEITEELKAKFKYVFADEYQDVNGVQEEILSLISRDNSFMVGDVKQSIYAFRGCDPDIFGEKFRRFKETGKGKAISLDLNFRSADKIIDSVNDVFCEAMKKDTCGIDYSANPMIRGADFPDGYGEAILHVIEGDKPKKKKNEGVYRILDDLENEEDEEEFYEGALISRIIEDELKKSVFDAKLGKYRPVEPKDIVILTRSGKTSALKILKELARNHIRLSRNTSSRFYP